jgi:hypothetical protein
LFHPPGEKMKRKGKEMEEEREDEKMDIEDVWCSRKELQVVVVLILVVALPKTHPSVLSYHVSLAFLRPGQGGVHCQACPGPAQRISVV